MASILQVNVKVNSTLAHGEVKPEITEVVQGPDDLRQLVTSHRNSTNEDAARVGGGSTDGDALNPSSCHQHRTSQDTTPNTALDSTTTQAACSNVRKTSGGGNGGGANAFVSLVRCSANIRRLTDRFERPSSASSSSKPTISRWKEAGVSRVTESASSTTTAVSTNCNKGFASSNSRDSPLASENSVRGNHPPRENLGHNHNGARNGPSAIMSARKSYATPSSLSSSLSSLSSLSTSSSSISNKATSSSKTTTHSAARPTSKLYDATIASTNRAASPCHSRSSITRTSSPCTARTSSNRTSSPCPNSTTNTSRTSSPCPSPTPSSRTSWPAPSTTRTSSPAQKRPPVNKTSPLCSASETSTSRTASPSNSPRGRGHSQSFSAADMRSKPTYLTRHSRPGTSTKTSDTKLDSTTSTPSNNSLNRSTSLRECNKQAKPTEKLIKTNHLKNVQLERNAPLHETSSKLATPPSDENIDSFSGIDTQTSSVSKHSHCASNCKETNTQENLYQIDDKAEQSQSAPKTVLQLQSSNNESQQNVSKDLKQEPKQDLKHTVKCKSYEEEESNHLQDIKLDSRQNIMQVKEQDLKQDTKQNTTQLTLSVSPRPSQEELPGRGIQKKYEGRKELSSDVSSVNSRQTTPAVSSLVPIITVTPSEGLTGSYRRPPPVLGLCNSSSSSLPISSNPFPIHSPASCPPPSLLSSSSFYKLSSLEHERTSTPGSPEANVANDNERAQKSQANSSRAKPTTGMPLFDHDSLNNNNVNDNLNKVSALNNNSNKNFHQYYNRNFNSNSLTSVNYLNPSGHVTRSAYLNIPSHRSPALTALPGSGGQSLLPYYKLINNAFLHRRLSSGGSSLCEFEDVAEEEEEEGEEGQFNEQKENSQNKRTDKSLTMKYSDDSKMVANGRFKRRGERVGLDDKFSNSNRDCGSCIYHKTTGTLDDNRCSATVHNPDNISPSSSSSILLLSERGSSVSSISSISSNEGGSCSGSHEPGSPPSKPLSPSLPSHHIVAAATTPSVGGCPQPSDLGRLKETAEKLHLSTRRPSTMAWRQKYLVGDSPGWLKVQAAATRAAVSSAATSSATGSVTLVSDGKLTLDRKQRIDDALDWLREELQEMRSQDQNLARQLLTIRHDIHQLKLQRCTEEHQDLIDDFQSELEELQEFSDVLDLPHPVYGGDNPLRHVGVTRLNLSARRFSAC